VIQVVVPAMRTRRLAKQLMENDEKVAQEFDARMGRRADA
jgi:hypothetical protein